MVTKIPLSDIVFVPAIYKKKLEKSIIKYGLLVPIIVEMRDDGQYNVIDGRRRLSALRNIYKKNIDEIMIDVKVEEKSDLNEFKPLVSNYIRSDNFINDTEICITLREKHPTDKIARMTSIDIAVINKMLSLKKLGSVLFTAFKDGKIKKTVAFNIIKLPEQYIELFELKLRFAGKVTQSDVNEVKKTASRGKDSVLIDIIDEQEERHERLRKSIYNIAKTYSPKAKLLTDEILKFLSGVNNVKESI